MVRSIFAGLITIIFSIVFFASFVLFLLLNTLLNVDFYEGSLSESLYEASVDVVTTSVVGAQGDIEVKFSEADFEKVLRETITAEDFEDILVPFVENLVEPEFDETGVAVIEVDFSGVVDKLPNFVGTLSSYLFDTISPCEVGVIPSEENFCIPDGVPEEDFKNQVTQVLNTQILENIPLKLTVFELHEGDLHLFAGYELNKDFLWTVWWGTFMVQILLLLVISLIILKPLHRVIRWIGKPLIASSIFTGVIFMMLYQAPKFISSMATSEKAGDGFDTAQAESVMYFLGDFFGLLATKALMYSAAIFIIGLSIYVFGLLLKHHEHE
jgi:hypothetical protein